MAYLFYPSVSLGLHPALYFYARAGAFQSGSLFSYIVFFSDWDTDDFMRFTRVRQRFEDFISSNSGITEAVRRLGSGARSRPRILSLFKTIIDDLDGGKPLSEITRRLTEDEQFAFFIAAEKVQSEDSGAEGAFSRDAKGATYIKSALPTAPRCPTCSGLMHRNGM